MNTNNNGKKFILLSTAVCLLPIILYLLVYDQLPEQMGMQWDMDGNVNWYAPKAVAVFAVPAFLALIHLFSQFARRNDPNRHGTSVVMQSILDWAIPIASIGTYAYSYLSNMGKHVPSAIPLIVIGLFFIVLGNYLPKTRQNYTIGIRLPWTLTNADNWNKTHRLAGLGFVMAGVLLIVSSVLPISSTVLLGVIISIILLCVIIPMLYSFLLYKKQPRDNNNESL